MKKRKFYIIGNPAIRNKITSAAKFIWKCTVYAFALIGVGNVAFFVYYTLKYLY